LLRPSDRTDHERTDPHCPPEQWIAVLDLVAIASGFVLRAAAGAAAVDVPMSSWFVLVTTFGSLSIVTGKRYAEAIELDDGAHEVRSTLGEYTEGYLRFVLAVAVEGRS
jgi:decaprenyl-phosphate phosphoribosyltransferase